MHMKTHTAYKQLRKGQALVITDGRREYIAPLIAVKGHHASLFVGEHTAIATLTPAIVGNRWGAEFSVWRVQNLPIPLAEYLPLYPTC